MNSRELLEAAARACGYTVKGEAVDADDYFTHLLVNHGHGTKKFRWNPLSDNTDALRLAVMLDLVIDTRGLSLEGTRRAIVTAAALKWKNA